MPLSDQQVRRLVTRYQRTIASIGESTAPKLTALWLDIGPSFDDAEQFEAEAERIIGTPKAAAVRLSVALYSTLLEARPPTIAPSAVRLPDRLREPSIAFWRAINQGHPEADALASGAARAEAVARDLITSAGRRTGDLVTARTEHYGQWRRITDSGACDWCRGMTRHLWNSAEAADFGHDRCGCTPVPA